MGRLISDQPVAVVQGVALAAQDSQAGRLRGRYAAGPELALPARGAW
jgi:hypothetical protein